MTEDELKAIEARTNAATPGPWQLHDGGDGVYDIIGDGRDVVQQVMSPDAEFIAAARTDVPKLVKEVRRQATELRRLRETLAQAQAINQRWHDDLREAGEAAREQANEQDYDA